MNSNLERQIIIDSLFDDTNLFAGDEIDRTVQVCVNDNVDSNVMSGESSESSHSKSLDSLPGGNTLEDFGNFRGSDDTFPKYYCG